MKRTVMKLFGLLACIIPIAIWVGCKTTHSQASAVKPESRTMGSAHAGQPIRSVMVYYYGAVTEPEPDDRGNFVTQGNQQIHYRLLKVPFAAAMTNAVPNLVDSDDMFSKWSPTGHFGITPLVLNHNGRVSVWVTFTDNEEGYLPHEVKLPKGTMVYVALKE